MNINDAKHQALVDFLGTDGSTNDLEFQWLNGETGAATTQDGWYLYLTALGYSGSIKDMQYQWLGDEGYTGSLNDRFLQFWTDGIPPSVVYKVMTVGEDGGLEFQGYRVSQYGSMDDVSYQPSGSITYLNCRQSDGLAQLRNTGNIQWNGANSVTVFLYNPDNNSLLATATLNWTGSWYSASGQTAYGNVLKARVGQTVLVDIVGN